MPDTLTLLAVVTLAVTGLSVVLARLIPDEYDRLKSEPIPVRTRDPR